jgi:hypothetical protein
MPALDAFSLDGHAALVTLVTEVDPGAALLVAERTTADGAAGTAKDGYIAGQVLPVDGRTVI